MKLENAPRSVDAEIANLIREGQPIDQDRQDIRMFIEQPQPVLYLCRGEAEDFNSFLGGLNSVLIARPKADRKALLELSQSVLTALADRFGKALLAELWSGPPEMGRAHDLRLIVTQDNAPDRTVEALERALAHCRLNHRHWRVALDVAETVAPPEFEPLLPQDAGPELCVIGIELAPRWRGEKGSLGHPKLLREMRRGLERALKQSGHHFARWHTRAAAPHYHVLGRSDLTDNVRVADRKICGVADAYSLLLDITPVNVPAARAFFRGNGRTRAPEFHYRPLNIDPAELKRRLYQVDLASVENPALHDLLESKRHEIDREITLLDNRCHPRFLADSIGLFGAVDRDLADLARDVLDMVSVDCTETDKTISSESFCARASAELDRLRSEEPTLTSQVHLRDDLAGLVVSRGDLLVGREMCISETRVEALIQHEIGTHVLTWHNGGCQPLRQLETGMAGYEETQEGIAVLAEFLVGGLTPRRLRVIAARVLAVRALIDRADFVEVFRMLQEHDLSDSEAFTTAMRVFRGGGLTKDAVYLRGLDRVLAQLACGTKLEDLFVGKIDLGAWPIVEELRWREIVEAPRLLPAYLSHPASIARLEQISTGLTVPAIAKEICS